MEEKTDTVGTEGEGNVERLGIIESLLHAISDVVFVVLGFDNGNGDVRPVVQNVVGTLGFAASVHLAPDDDSPLGKCYFLAYLGVDIPSSADDGQSDVLGTDIALGKVLLGHSGPQAVVIPSA